MSTPSTCCRCLQEPKLSPQLPSSGRMAPRHLEALYDHLDSEDTTRQARRPPANCAAPAVNGSARGSSQPPRVEISPPRTRCPIHTSQSRCTITRTPSHTHGED